MATLLIKNGIVITLGDKNKVLYDHAVLCKDGKISKIGKTKEFTGKYDKVIDARGKVVMPGIINAHHHFYSTMVRGLGKAKASANFSQVLENLWWRLDKKLTVEDSYYSALFPLVDCIKRGVTTVIDHHASPFHAKGSLNAIADAVEKTGLRASLCYELSDRDGAKIAKDGIDENVNFIKRAQKDKTGQFKALFGMHASFTVSDKTMEKAVEAAKDLKTGFHVHTAEAKSDQDETFAKHGMRVVERFDKWGVLGPQTLCVHCIHINEKEMDLLKKTNTMVVCNPQSNLNNAVGIADIMKMSQKGILVGLGTDAMTSNMFEEYRTAMWTQHYKHDDPTCAFMEVANLLPFNNAKIANRFWDNQLGELKEGKAADIILIDYYPFTKFDETTFLGHFLFGLSQSFVDTTIANGKVLMENKQLTLDIDLEKESAKALDLSKKLWARF